jgi:hypothetical protein
MPNSLIAGRFPSRTSVSKTGKSPISREGLSSLSTRPLEAPKPVRQSQRDRLLGLFAPKVASALIEFAAAIHSIDADVIIFMARKALRLHDFLVLAGCRPSKRATLSSHVLEQNLSVFKGKRVALVDDTLILGSTLGRATAQLRAAGAASVQSCVLAVDLANWCRDLATPDKVFLHLEPDAMLTLCANEVEALAVSGIPYLSDFPISKAVRFAPARLDILHSLPEWQAFALTSASQDQAGTATFSFLPRPETISALMERLGPFAGISDIMKVRSYLRTADDRLWLTFVPVLTIKPLAVEAVERLWRAVINHVGFRRSYRQLLDKHFETPKARLRIMQYYASLIIGRAFSDNLVAGGAALRPLAFDKNEAVRLFGPWLRGIVDEMHDRDQTIHATRKITPEQLPQQVDTITQKELQQAIRRDPFEPSPAFRTRNVFTDLSRAFTQLYHEHELPARAEAHRLGKAIFNADISDAPHRDRLDFGFAWTSLVKCMLRNERLPNTPVQSMRLSLMLDILIDAGIAVPVLCERDGILFRAYRHGEDVLFTDQEAALAHEIFAGYLKGSGRTYASRIVFEKLLVSLFRVGAEKGFLKVVHGVGGGERVARIGFHLHGALPFVPFENTIFAEEQDSWISNYLMQDGVIRQIEGGYALGEPPEAAMPKASSRAEARQLGMLIGILMHTASADGRAALDEHGLILLTSCPQPRDTTGAVLAELRLFLKQFRELTVRLRTRRDSGGGNHYARLDWSSPKSIRAVLKRLLTSHAYTAIHSARLKLGGYRTSRPLEVYRTCEACLEGVQGGFLADSWRGDWAPIVATENVDQAEVFGPLIDALECEVLCAALGLFSIELALLSAEAGNPASPAIIRKYDKACAKVLSYLEEFGSRMELPQDAQQLFDRLHKVSQDRSFMPNPAEACRFGIDFVENRRHMMTSVIRSAQPRVMDYGTTETPTYYDLVLWYDIINSTGEKSDSKGDLLRTYRARVRTFKERVNAEVSALMRAALEQNARIYAWDGAEDSTNDEKHVFFGGRRAISWMRDTSLILSRVARECGISLRVVMINGDFAGDRPHKYPRKVEISGEGFLESFSRVREGVKALEREAGISGSLLVWGAQSINPERLGAFKHFRWRSGLLNRHIPIRIENYPMEVPIWGGPAN